MYREETTATKRQGSGKMEGDTQESATQHTSHPGTCDEARHVQDGRGHHAVDVVVRIRGVYAEGVAVQCLVGVVHCQAAVAGLAAALLHLVWRWLQGKLLHVLKRNVVRFSVR